jgi:hypothetical protein
MCSSISRLSRKNFTVNNFTVKNFTVKKFTVKNFTTKSFATRSFSGGNFLDKGKTYSPVSSSSFEETKKSLNHLSFLMTEADKKIKYLETHAANVDLNSQDDVGWKRRYATKEIELLKVKNAEQIFFNAISTFSFLSSCFLLGDYVGRKHKNVTD